MNKYNILGDQHLSPIQGFESFFSSLCKQSSTFEPNIYLKVILKKERAKEIDKEREVSFLPDVFDFFRKIRERAYTNDVSIWFEEGAR